MPAKSANRNHRNNPYALDGLAARFHHSLAGALWRWRTELALTLVAAAAFTWLTITDGWMAAVIAAVVTAAVLGLAVVLPWSRRWLVARAWCVISRHRLQRLCFETRMHTRSGRLPLILRIKPTKVGERAYVLCRAGICVEDFEAHIGEIRAACYARDARVARNSRWSQLVTVDIVRHDPLSTGSHIPSRLRGHIGPHVPQQREPA